MRLFSNRQQRHGEDNEACLPGWTSVFLYNDPNDDDHMKGRLKNYDGTKTCETICREIAIENSITPTMLHFFGLSIVDVSAKSYVWLSPNQTLDNIGNHAKNYEIHFRMRFIPHMSKLNNLLLLDEACFNYLFAQITWDFLKDCLPCYEASDKVEEARGVSCMLMLYKLRQDTEKHQKGFDDWKYVVKKNFDSFLPDSLQKSYFAGKKVLKDSMKKYLYGLIEKFPLQNDHFNSTYMMQWFLKHNMSVNHAFYEESFVAYSLEIEEEFENIDGEPPLSNLVEKLNIAVELGQLNPKLIVVKENNEEFFKIELLDLIKLDVSEKTEDGRLWWRIQIHRQSGHPQEIYFNDKLMANSFLTCLECYCRCVYDFYTSLCTDVKPNGLRGIERIRAHGPVSEEFIKRILVKRNSRDLYILRTNPKSYGRYDVFYLSNQNEKLKSAILPKIVQQDEGYIVEGSTDAPVDIKDLISRLIQNASILPASVKTQAQRIKPTSEGCDLLWKLLFENFSSQKDEEDEDMRRERKRIENQPKVYMEADIQKMSFIGAGYFTETCYGMLQEKDMIVIKQLRTDRIPDVDFRTVYQEFQVGFQKLMTLSDPKFFVAYYGVLLSTTPSMLIGGSRGNHGSLCHFLQYRKPSPMLSLHHLLEVCVQLASALEHMVNINCFHGNLHCANLAVMTFDERYLIVKITDPGLVTLFNKLPISHVINQARLPWLAPELHGNLSAVNRQTEVYAYGTTLWQMFSNGLSPLHHDPKIVSLNPEQIQEFFAQGSETLSCPDILQVQPGDPDQIQELKTQLYKVMKSCWTLDAEERMEPIMILRELNYNMESYGEIYHKYNEISYFTHDVGTSAPAFPHNTSAREQRNSSGFQDTGRISVPDISVLRVARNLEAAGPSLPRLVSNQNERSRMPVEAGGLVVGPSRPIAMPRVNNPVAGGVSIVRRTGNLPLLPSLPFHLIEDRRLVIGEVIGAGHYGQVRKGKLKPIEDQSIDGNNSLSEVVVKELKKEMRDKCDDSFKKEAQVMANLSHPNIVKFYGMSSTGRYLVMEYLPNNSLIKYIKSQRGCGGMPFLKLAVDITAGMAFLEDNNVLHCDLAARNILLTSDLRAKISDFGLSKMLPLEINYYRKHDDQTIPIPWCSPEVIEVRGKFTTKSDVWSFGVVLWEMYSYGKPPYLCHNVPEMLKKLHEGARLKKPDACPDEVYGIMKQCWDIQPNQRPSFHLCQELFQNMLITPHGLSFSTATPKIPERPPGTCNSQGPKLSLAHSAANSNARSLVKDSAKTSDVNMHSVNTVTTNQSFEPNVCIERKDLHIKENEILGKGAFGKVYKGMHNGKPVAIKECTRDEEYARFKREFMILYKLRNQSENIVQFIGICKMPSTGDMTKYWYVMECLGGGSLYAYLQKQKKDGHTITCVQRLHFLIDIAKGMECLFNKRIIHCDLSANNVLLDDVGPRLVAKIGDFGWAKELDGEEVNFMYQRKEPQIKMAWAAPESFKEIYCIFSDIWSYGAVCIEVFKDGETPALNIPLPVIKDGINQQYFNKFYQAILSGTRFPRPNHCPEDVYDEVLYKCWFQEPKDRIAYCDILKILKRKVEKESTTESLLSSANVSNV